MNNVFYVLISQLMLWRNQQQCSITDSLGRKRESWWQPHLLPTEKLQLRNQHGLGERVHQLNAVSWASSPASFQTTFRNQNQIENLSIKAITMSS